MASATQTTRNLSPGAEAEEELMKQKPSIASQNITSASSVSSSTPQSEKVKYTTKSGLIFEADSKTDPEVAESIREMAKNDSATQSSEKNRFRISDASFAEAEKRTPVFSASGGSYTPVQRDGKTVFTDAPVQITTRRQDGTTSVENRNFAPSVAGAVASSPDSPALSREELKQLQDNQSNNVIGKALEKSSRINSLLRDPNNKDLNYGQLNTIDEARPRSISESIESSKRDYSTFLNQQQIDRNTSNTRKINQQYTDDEIEELVKRGRRITSSEL